MARSRQDIFKVAVTVLLINLMLAVAMESLAVTSNPSDDVVEAQLNSMFEKWGVYSGQIDKAGLVINGVNTETQCNELNGVWDSKSLKCKSDVGNEGDVDFSFFDIFGVLLKIPLYIWKVIKFIALVVFFEIAVSYKLSPLINNSIILGFVNLILWSYQAYVLYYVYGFVTNFRGQQVGLE